MKNIYTLEIEMRGKQESLNGTIFFLKKHTAFPNDFETVQFIDPISNQIIWQTSAIKEIDKYEDRVIIVTQNSTYHLIDVRSCIPTGIKASSIEKLSLEIISEEKIGYKAIHYGDGYFKTQVTFNHPTNEKEICDFFKEHDRIYKTKNEVPWWEKYIDLIPISEDKTIWEVTEWDRYTD